MKVTCEWTIEVNNQHKVNVDEQQNDIKYLKEQCNKSQSKQLPIMKIRITYPVLMKKCIKEGTTSQDKE